MALITGKHTHIGKDYVSLRPEGSEYIKKKNEYK